MIEAMGAVMDLVGRSAIAGVIVFLRVSAAMAALPGLGERTVPLRVRLCLAIAFTAVVAPTVAVTIPLRDERPAASLVYFATEPLIGVALGIVLRLMIHALEMAGTMAAQSASLSQLFGSGGEPMPAISHLFTIGGLALMMMLGLHVRMAEFLILSYDILPPGLFPSAGSLPQWGIENISRAFGLAFSLAAPFVIASLIYNIALGAINRAMPQLMVAFVGAPALTAGALVLLAIAAPAALALWAASFASFLDNPFGGAG